MRSNTRETPDAGAMKWGYAFAGACALGFAALIQVAFDGLDEEALARLPAIVTVPYGMAGKLGITVPLALLGVGLILRDLLVNRRAVAARPEAAVPGRATRNARARQAEPVTAPVAVEELEVGEPLADEMSSPAPAAKPAAPLVKPGKKIAALAGAFDGRHDGAPVTTGGPVGDAEPIAQRPGSGQVVLSSAKYLNKNPGGSFRKGTSSHTHDE
jgi:hypothetical protein